MQWNHESTAANQSPRTPSVLSSHSQATARPPQANIGLRVRNRHLKSARTYAIPARKQTLVEDNGKPFGEQLRMLPSYTFYTERFFKNPLVKVVRSAILLKLQTKLISELRNSLLRSPFGRPTPVSGRAPCKVVGLVKCTGLGLLLNWDLGLWPGAFPY